MCGLDYVYLRSGYRLQETEYGSGVSIKNADHLDRAIALQIIFAHARLRGQEVRFFRSLIHNSQTELANALGVKRITVARWEGAPTTPIPGPSDRLLRLVVANNLCCEDCVGAVLNGLGEITDEHPEKLVMSYRPDETMPQESLFPSFDEDAGEEVWKPERAA
jgi:DNA-binding transcriptional regulator YiaG